MLYLVRGMYFLLGAGLCYCLRVLSCAAVFVGECLFARRFGWHKVYDLACQKTGCDLDCARKRYTGEVRVVCVSKGSLFSEVTTTNCK